MAGHIIISRSCLRMRLLIIVAIVCVKVFVSASAAGTAMTYRPTSILQAIESNSPLYYFGIGSNMLKSKIISRGMNGTIAIKSMVPGIARNFRLAFNLRGFPPIEPAMAGIECANGDICHGALVELDGQEYQKLWISEGGASPQPGYRELFVDVTPYGSSTAVQAVALTASDHSKLRNDGFPSARYMDLLIQGATELQLTDTYIQYLKSIPTAQPSEIIKLMCRYHSYWTGWLFRTKLRGYFKLVSKFLWAVNVSPTSTAGKRALSELCTAFILLPGSILGLLVAAVYRVSGKHPPSPFGRVLEKPKLP